MLIKRVADELAKMLQRKLSCDPPFSFNIATYFTNCTFFQHQVILNYSIIITYTEDSKERDCFAEKR